MATTGGATQATTTRGATQATTTRGATQATTTGSALTAEVIELEVKLNAWKDGLVTGESTIIICPSKRKNACLLWEKEFGFPFVDGFEVILQAFYKNIR